MLLDFRKIFHTDPPTLYIAKTSPDQLTNQQLNLPYNKTKIGLQLGYLWFKNQNIISRYRISKNTPWEYTKERSFQFTSLAPDDYTFELEYSIDNAHWIPSGISFTFKVNPPWWQQWYFITGIILVSFSIIFLYARFQIKNYQQKNQHYHLLSKLLFAFL